MKITKTTRKWLATSAAISSSVFFFAACEPQDNRPAEGPEDPDAPTYGQPDREPAEPGMEDQSEQWDEEPGTGTDTSQ